MTATTAAARAFNARFGCSLPLVCPPMAGVSGGRLAAAVHRAGGFSYIGAGHKPFETLVDDVRLAREALATPEGDLPIGVGFMGWKFEEPKMGKEAGAKEGDKWLSFIIHEAQARSIWISFANDLEYWVDRARRLESEPAQQTGATQRPRRERLLIAVMVHSAEQAKAALTWDHLDAVILQGTEAGGHGADFQHGRPLAQLLDEVLPLRPSPDARPLVLAAGGISSPSAVSRQLAREGVAAVVCGTSFSVASESTLSDSQKDLLVRAEDGESGTARSGRWDVARGTTGWPEGVDGRGLRDAVSESTGEVQKGGAPVTWAGTGVGHVQRIAPAAEIVKHLTSGDS